MSKYKEIDECVSELNDCYDKLYKRYCDVENCRRCVLSEDGDYCILNDLQDLINKLEETQL